MDPVSIPSIAAGTFPLPPRLEGLRRLAYNLHWAWEPRTRNLWSLIDRTAWTRYRNPIPVISGPTEWSRLLDDEKFLAEYQDTLGAFDRYMADGSGHWFAQEHGDQFGGPIAYFCAEYGIHESLGIYSGGLGVLAGDHMKSASDLAMPLVGVGLLYRKGYFRQQIDADGHQEHNYPDYDLTRLPLARVQGQDGLPLTITVELPERELSVAVWLAQVGRIPVLLLDSDVSENAVEDRPITHILYVRGREMRLHQELVLGVGGVRAIRALGLAPAVWHLNEGHSAFLLAERAGEYVTAGADLSEAWSRVRRDSVFTIHTPVSAGNERFDDDLVRRVAGPILERRGIPLDALLELGLGTDGDRGQFDMTAFSLRLTNGANAVSQLHAQTANATWQGVTDHPIQAVTNGIHGPTWVGAPIADLLERHLDARLASLDAGAGQDCFWDRLERIPVTELWEAHLRQKRELAIFVRRRLQSQ
ncbi:MAG: alpha-glucan family phosphorylase, partial [Chloroflexi bacterium]|nr:alpha-glucan family phosphorylase [Chloroflexota bacterium]